MVAAAVWGKCMIGLVLVTHGALADEFKLAMEHVVGPQENVETIAIGPEDNAESRRDDILSAIDRADSGGGVIILTDMFGGTPSNLAISVMQNRNVEVIAGVNLPMLVKLGRVRADMGIEQAVTIAQEAGRKYITVANALLGG
jgi:PTS system mannose-specific IIA component